MASAQDAALIEQLRRLEQDVNDLQRFVYAGKGGKLPVARPDSPGMSVDAATRLHLKMQSFSSEVASLTSRVETLEHSLVRLDQRLEKLISDVDYRLRTLESASVGASTAGQPSEGDATQPNQPIQSSTPPKAEKKSGEAHSGQQGEQVLGTISESDLQRLKPGAKVARATGVKPAEKREPPKGTPDEKYAYAFGLLKERDLEGAQRSFKAFSEAHSDHPLAGNAFYWLGETYYARKEYAEAARIFLDGYRRYPESNKAPDSLLKLGKSLSAVGEKSSACAAYRKLVDQFPKANRRLKDTAKRDMDALGCG